MNMMMNNMFSMFDPSSSFMSLAWIMMIIPIFLNIFYNNKKENKINKFMSTISNFLQKEMSQLMEKKLKINSVLMSKLFFMVMIMNMIAIFPFNFTPTAHIVMSLPLSLMMWASTMIFGWVNKFKEMTLHLTPLGTPPNLMNFMVLIELVSSLIRPITLSIRLSANMVAGHLLMSLLSSFSLTNTYTTFFSYLVMMILTMLETMVAMVQAYVITTLLILYQNETS